VPNLADDDGVSAWLHSFSTRIQVESQTPTNKGSVWTCIVYSRPPITTPNRTEPETLITCVFLFKHGSTISHESPTDDKPSFSLFILFYLYSLRIYDDTSARNLMLL
jgi:hypothetical protein